MCTVFVFEFAFVSPPASEREVGRGVIEPKQPTFTNTAHTHNEYNLFGQ